MTSMANLGKLVSNGPNGAPTVLLQSQAGNILLPSGVKAGGVAGSGQTAVVRQGQVMVRQGQQSPVLVQLPSGLVKSPSPPHQLTRRVFQATNNS